MPGNRRAPVRRISSTHATPNVQIQGVHLARVQRPGAQALGVSTVGITEALKADHDKARRLIRQIQDNRSAAPRLYPQLSDALKRHNRAEEQTFYAALRQDPTLANLLVKSEAQHHALGQSLRRIDATPFGHAVWRSRFNQAVKALESHLASEESRVFAEARKRLTKHQQIELARRYIALMRSDAPGSGLARAGARHVARSRVRAVLNAPRTLMDRILNVVLPVR